ncbi:hypothetical protein A2886_01900 [candidate division WWE3 bacterium RIFCSPHIGHO2_01_FULL_42_13]|uniref:Uncharacterized protein n=1 Tax=candidate division WWE3 bacterium RIFCSPHIGHO2_01_FULL_42_13 TaxID=1802617 RepID=A0A1F4UQV3_UNCKA|nr:MAG: hypothetical protein A2886_01900 [candidate division WWE3 bacterium RIFCSPHIGHO2_01_FULL_42_13]
MSGLVDAVIAVAGLAERLFNKETNVADVPQEISKDIILGELLARRFVGMKTKDDSYDGLLEFGPGLKTVRMQYTPLQPVPPTEPDTSNTPWIDVPEEVTQALLRL